MIFLLKSKVLQAKMENLLIIRLLHLPKKEVVAQLL